MCDHSINVDADFLQVDTVVNIQTKKCCFEPCVPRGPRDTRARVVPPDDQGCIRPEFV